MVTSRRTFRRPLTRRRALAPRRRTVRSVMAGTVALAANEIDAFDLMGVVVNDPQGLTHVATWGLISAYPTTVITGGGVAANTLFRWAYSSRLDTTAVANLASAALLPLRDFSAAGAQPSDHAWKGREYHHAHYITGGTFHITPAGDTDPIRDSSHVNYRVTRLGTLDQGEGWYIYIRNSTAVAMTFYLDFQTLYLLG